MAHGFAYDVKRGIGDDVIEFLAVERAVFQPAFPEKQRAGMEDYLEAVEYEQEVICALDEVI